MAKKAFALYIKEHKVVDENGKIIGVYREVSPEVVKKAFIFSKNYVGMYPPDIPLPSYWREEISKAYGELKSQVIEEAKMEDPLLRLVLEGSRYLKLLESALKRDIEREKEGYLGSIGWKAHEIGALGHEMLKLRKLGVVKVVYKSNKHTGYKLVDRGRVEEVVERAKSLMM